MRELHIPNERAWQKLRIAARDRREVQARPPQMRTGALPNASTRLALARSLVWLGMGLRFHGWLALDALLGRSDPKRMASYATTLLTGAGPTAVKVGKQLAARLDLLPIEVVDALDQMRDEMPAFPAEQAIARVERAARRPIEALCEVFDPQPIVSEIASCVWQAELRTGEKVAFRVRRPGIREQLAAEHFAFVAVASLFAMFTSLRVEQVAMLRKELRWALDEELDFVRISRFQRRLRKRLRRGPKRVGVARVLRKLTSEDVITTEFVSGVWLDELIALREQGDELALQKLAARGIVPSEVAGRVLRFGWWCMFDEQFHPSHPSLGDFVVQDGGRLVMVDVGACSMAPGRKRLLGREVMSRLSDNDVSGAASAFVEMLSPLPFLDTKELGQKIEGALWPALFAMRNRELPWYERTSGGVWLGALEVGHSFGARFRLEPLRLMRASIQFDLLAAQVWPRTNILGRFRRFEAESRLRSARRGARRVQRWFRRTPAERYPLQLERDIDTFRRLELLYRLFISDVPVDFQALSKKGAYAWAIVLQATVTLSAVTLLGIGGVWAWRGGERGLVDAVMTAVMHPLYGLVLALAFVSVSRVVMFRLDDRE